MKSAYRILAFLTAAGVLFQVAVIAYLFFGLGGFVEGGGNFDKAALENGGYPGAAGGDLHGIGANVVAALALLLLISSFFAKIPGGVKWAAITFGLVVLQWGFAFLAFAAPATGFLHGINALILFAVAGMTGARVRRVTAAAPVPVAPAA